METEREKGGSAGWKEQVLRFFFPVKCAVCKECGYEILCSRCREALDAAFAPRVFLANGGNGFADRMLALFPFDVLPVKILLYDWKRSRRRDTPLIFREYLSRAAISEKYFPAPHVVTFAPRRPSARREAGFDQAEALARELACVLDVPFEELLIRRGRSRAQHRLKGEKREVNVRGVFHASKALSGQTVYLVDDVVTTGASVRECARILKAAGAQKVFVIAVAA